MTPDRLQQGLPSPAEGAILAKGSLLTAILFAAGGSLLVTTYGSVLALLFPLLLAFPALLYLAFHAGTNTAEIRIFARSFAIGILAAGVASYYAIVLLDPFQLSSDASSFFKLSSQSGPARSLQDLQTLTEGAGAVVLWGWFYDIASVLGFPREPYVGISVNVIIVAWSAVFCARSARCLYGDDDYRINRLVLFFTISGDMWLFAGVHIRDSSIFLVIVMLTHFWISYLAELKHGKIILPIGATLLAMPALEVLRKEFFYIPLAIGFIALICLNFSRGRGDNRFITLVTVFVGLLLLVVGWIAFGEQVQTLLLNGQQTYSNASIADSRSGSLGTALIVNQSLPIRIMLGVPYLLYFPIPFWTGLNGASAIDLFKSINVVSFYFISAFVFAGAFLILADRRLRSPAFLFVVLVPFLFSVSVALTSLESRHLGAFMSLFFLVGLMPDARYPPERRVLRFCLVLISASVVLGHGAWFVLRYV